MSSEIIGDTSHLHNNTVGFNAVQPLKGVSGSGNFLLHLVPSFASLAAPHSHVKIISGSLKCQIIGPTVAEKSLTAYIAVVPSHVEPPTAAANLLTIDGSAIVVCNAFTGPSIIDLSFPAEVTHSVKPPPIIGYLPRIAYAFEIQGGVSSDVSYIRISGTLLLEGVGFVKTW